METKKKRLYRAWKIRDRRTCEPIDLQERIFEAPNMDFVARTLAFEEETLHIPKMPLVQAKDGTVWYIRFYKYID